MEFEGREIKIKHGSKCLNTLVKLFNEWSFYFTVGVELLSGQVLCTFTFVNFVVWVVVLYYLKGTYTVVYLQSFPTEVKAWCLISSSCRESRSQQRKPQLLCLQQQFSGGSHPSAFYSYDHCRLRSVPLQTQVSITALLFSHCDIMGQQLYDISADATSSAILPISK